MKLGFVYFMQIENLDGYIKIGFSTNIFGRQSAIQTCCPYSLNVLALLPNETVTTEHTIHAMLSSSRLSGEWFKPTPEVLECIEYVKHGKFKDLIDKRMQASKINISYA